MRRPRAKVRQPLSRPSNTLRARAPDSRRAHLAAWAVLTAVGAVLFAVSFERWGDPIIDLGRDLYLPGQLLEGRVLYRDLLYNYGPLAPYLLASVVAFCGDSLAVFEAIGCLVGLATLAGLYAIGCRLAGVRAGFASALLFLLLGFFANSSWGCNFVLPYAFAATLATAFAVWSFELLLAHLAGERGIAPSVGLMVAALLTKQEVGLGIAAVHAIAWWAHPVSRRAIGLTLGVCGAVAGAVLALFSARGPEEHSLLGENLARFLDNGASTEFFRVVAGFDEPGRLLLRSIGAAGQLALIGGLAAGAGLALSRWPRRKAVALLALPCLLACGVLGWRWAGVRLFQAVPFVALGAIVSSAVRNRRDPLLLLGSFCLLAAPRVLLQYHPLWYGFFLLVPSYPFVVYTFGWRGVAWFPPAVRRSVVVAFTALALLVLARFEWTMWHSYRDKDQEIPTAKGTMRDDPGGRAAAIAAFLAYAEEELVPLAPRMVVLPEGVSLNYLTGLENPTAYYLFTPPEIDSPTVEARLIRELEATRPELLLFTSRDLTEFGRRGIGLDYAHDLGDWIRASYDLDRVFEGRESPPWRLLLLRRRASLPVPGPVAPES